MTIPAADEWQSGADSDGEISVDENKGQRLPGQERIHYGRDDRTRYVIADRADGVTELRGVKLQSPELFKRVVICPDCLQSITLMVREDGSIGLETTWPVADGAAP